MDASWRSAVLGLLAAIAVAGLGLSGAAARHAEAAGGAALTLTPSHGLPGQAFGVTYTVPLQPTGACSDFAEITWDGSVLEDTGPGTVVAGACDFTATLTPPSGAAAPGPHDVVGSACVVVNSVGTCDPATATPATYTIDGTRIAVSPATGLAGATFTATYDLPAGDCRGALEAQFLWFGVGGIEIGRAPFDTATCTATLAGATVPSGAYPGANPVTALVCSSPRSCDATTAPAVDATYDVQVPTSVALAPASGDGLTPFTATYAQTTPECIHSDVRFGWDGVLDAAWTAPLDRGTCSGSMSLTPPPGAAPGDHQVTAQACYQGQTGLTCEAWTAPQKVAVYTIPFPPPSGVASIAKASDRAQVAAGGTVTYTLTLSVFGVASMPGVSILDQLPPEIGSVTAISGGGIYSATTNSVTWRGISVTDGERLTYRALVSLTAAPAQSPFVNTAQISAGLCEICSASASVVVQPPPLVTPTPTPTRTPRPGPTQSPGSTAVPKPTPGPTRGPSPVPGTSPAGSVEEATGSPEPSEDPAAFPVGPAPSTPPGDGLDSVIPPAGAPDRNSLLADFTASIPGPAGLVFDPEVVGTNLALALIFVFLFGLTSEIFNSTIDEHREEIESWWQRMLRGPLLIFAPLMKLDAAFDGLAESGRRGAVLHGMGIVAVIGLVYGLLSPDFGLNEQSLILIASLMIGAGFVTYLNYGGKSLLIRRRHGAHSVVRLYGTAVMVAIACVLATRLIGFHPGIIYGFMASTVILTPIALARRDEARIVLVPAAVLLIASLVAWILLIPVDAAADEPGAGVGIILLKSVLTIVFIGGLEGLMFNLIPLRYMDGARVMAWSRPAWALAFGLVTFLWWQLLLNRDQAYADALTQTSVGPVISALVFFGLTTGSVWVFFRLRDQRRPLEGEA